MADEKDAPTADREKTTVVVSRSLAGMVRTIADHHDITMSEVLDQHARPGILREYKKVLDAKQAELGGES